MLAETLGKTLGEIGEMPALEVEQWRAFFKVRAVTQEHEAKKRGGG